MAAHLPRLVGFTLVLLAKAQQTNRSTNGTNVSQQNDCAKRPGLPPDFPALYEELNNGSYSERLYGAKHKLPRCSQLRLLWLPLMDNATLRTIHLCGDKGMVPRRRPAVHEVGAGERRVLDRRDRVNLGRRRRN